MKSDQQQSTPERGSGNLLLLLFSLLFALLVVPALGELVATRVLSYSGVTAVLVFGVFVNRRRNRVFLPCLVLAVLAVFTIWATLIFNYSLIFVASCVLEAAFYATIAVVLVIQILTKHLATVQSIFGAVCVYLLFGLAWASLYWATESMDGESLSFRGRVSIDAPADSESIAPFSEVVYFSFVTMSTLGYGDIVPETPLARTLAWMQSVLGQFFLAVLVAWLVSALPRRRPLKGRFVNEAHREDDQCID
jgi:hypothetical protein